MMQERISAMLSLPLDPPRDNADAEAQRISAGVATGDEASFATLHGRYAPRLRRLLLALSRGDDLVAAEVAQSTFLTAAAKLRAVGSEAHLWNWLARVARQHLGKAWRRQRRNQAPLALDDVPEPAAERQAEDVLEAALARAVAGLDEDDRALLNLFYTDRLPQQQVGERLGITAKAVAGRLDRLRERLRREIQRRLRDET